MWGGSFVLAEIALPDMGPLTISLGRVVVGAAMLWAVLTLVGERFPPGKGLWPRLFLMALFNSVVPFTVIMWGQLQITAGLASILTATTPLFAVAIAHLATDDEKITPARLAGLAAGFVGVVVLIGPDLLGGLQTAGLASVAVLAGALSYAGSGVYGRRFRGQRPLVLAAGQTTAATVLLLPLVMLIDRPWTLPVPSTTALAAVAAMGALSTALGFIIFYRVLARAGATNMMLVNFLNPVSAIVLGSIVLGEEVTVRQVAGMAMIAVGLAALDGRPARFIAAALASRAPAQRPPDGR
jgi:drug/metabolite transporter (DMT)-like permease